MLFLLSFASAFLCECAGTIGGPPDVTPPEISNTFPKQGTINFQGRKVELHFTKYMNKNSVLENLYIQPLTNAEFDWSGKKLSIEFKENLKPNTTYLINLGTDYTDFKISNQAKHFL